MDQLMAFVQDQWLILAGALILLFFIVRLVKNVVKWAFILAIVVVFVFYGQNVVNTVKEQALDKLEEQAQTADFQRNADGTFTVKTEHVELRSLNANEAEITFKGYSFTIKLDDAVKKIAAIAENQSAK